MSTKMGRPKSNDPKGYDLKVRVNKDTHASLLKYSEQHKITKAEAIRRGISLLLNENSKS